MTYRDLEKRKKYMQEYNRMYRKTEAFRKALRRFQSSEKGKRHFSDQQLRKKYGITLVQYEELYKQQNGCCAICAAVEDKRLCVDHNHQTGMIRGLLCSKCNFLLGHGNDNPKILEKAIQYLRNHDSTL